MKFTRTNKDRRRRRRRPYPAFAGGLASLRESALRRRPWGRSTGPRTEAGKSRSKLNALKHGQCCQVRRAEQRQINASIRQLLAGDGCFDSSRDRDAWQKRMELELEDGMSRLIKVNRGE